MSRYTLLCPSCGGKLDAKTAPILNPSSYCCPLCGVPLRVASDIVLFGIPWVHVWAFGYPWVLIDSSRTEFHPRSCLASQA